MSPQRVLVKPVLDEDQAQRILSIVVYRVQEAPGFLSRPSHVLEAQREDAVQGVRPSADAAGDDDHEPTLVTVAATPLAVAGDPSVRCAQVMANTALDSSRIVAVVVDLTRIL
jgi:hypothetical protein